MEKRKGRVFKLLLCCLMISCFLGPLPFCWADDHERKGSHSERHDDRGKDSIWGRGTGGGGHDEGNETTGQIAAWSLAAVNLTVAVSLLIKGIKQFTPLEPEVKNSMVKFNTLQKKYLMKLHYYLNPIILAVALLHWTLSRCKSTALAEWGLVTMCVIAMLGIILKFKLCPKELLPNVSKVHTQPVIFLLLIALLLVGHLAMD